MHRAAVFLFEAFSDIHPGLTLDVVFTPELAIEGGLGYFSLSYDKYDGRLFTATAALEYRITDNIGVGAGYGLIDVDLSVD